MNIKKTLAFTGPFLLAASFVSAQQKGPFVNYKYPAGMNLLGGPSEKTIDCGTTFRFASQPKTLWATCNFLEQVDNNGQEICSVTDPGNFGSDEQQQRGNLSTALLMGLRHYAMAHQMCMSQAGKVELQTGKTPADVDRMFGAGWQQKSVCPLVDVTVMCKAAMSLDK